MNYLYQIQQALALLLTCLLWTLCAGSVHAAVNCTATMSEVAFGDVDLVNNTNTNTPTNGTLTYTCTNDDRNNAVQVNACFLIDGGQGHQGQLNPSYMVDTGNAANQLQFNLYWPNGSTVWTTNGYGMSTPFNPPVFTIAKAPNRNSTSSYTGTTFMPGRLVNSQSLPPNTGANFYQNSYAAGSTSIAWSSSNTNQSMPTTCGANQSIRFPFIVSAKVIKSCTVLAGAASDIQIGASGGVPADSVSSSGANSISVTCSKGTPYYIGLKPSNDNTSGAGVMSGTGGNTDQVPYQLRSVSTSGNVWGNTATATAVGNGVSGTGNGVAQSVPVFAIAPSADFTPDNYTDTVTVTVNY